MLRKRRRVMGMEIVAMLEDPLAKIVGWGILAIGFLGFVGMIICGVGMIAVDAIKNRLLLRRLPKYKAEELNI